MKARHVTSESSYRQPYGAAPLGGVVTLAIDVEEVGVQGCDLRLWTDEEGETLIAMERSAECPGRFVASFTPEHVGIIWYRFNITAEDGEVWRYGAREGRTAGEGDFAYGEPPSFQITVYVPREDYPEWYKNAIVYQIFPDRFARGRNWRERFELLDTEQRHGPLRRVVEDWAQPPRYQRGEDHKILAWDFYGGTLEGIREKLGYLEALGITCIYLNPIFEAASNHRYDTADFMAIDPLLGTEEEFSELCAEAAARGISIILDGVFNHTGCDSRYFNRYGNYPDVGAWQSEDSPYRSWFRFEEDGSYSSWWGVADLPDIEETDESYQDFICGENGVVRKWLRLGARGWRLDVADELPDSFIARIKEAALAERSDAVVIGEVWEDATTKVAYGELRKYFLGGELDATMNYPFRKAVLSFVAGDATAKEMAESLEQLQENYPPDNFMGAFNLLGSHDRERLFTVLGDAPKPNELSDAERADYRLSEGQRGLAKGRLWMSAFLQMTLPGVPSIYYGDECGLEGYRDPYNRATFPLDGGDKDCFNIYRNAIALRKGLPVLCDGSFEPFWVGESVFGFWRRNDAGDCVCVLANKSLEKSATVRLPMQASEVTDVISGRSPKVEDSSCEVFLWPLGTSILHFHEHVRMQKPLEPGVGVIAHITSVPNDDKPGTLGAPSQAFVDWLAEAGARYWQILPVNPTDEFGSPYAGLSAFAGNPRIMSEVSVEEYGKLAREKGFAAFCKRNAAWLDAYACFCAIKDQMGEELPWWLWPKMYRAYDSALLKRPELKGSIERHRLEQYAFELQMQATRAYANAHGVSLVGDMPMYVSADSSDVWAHRELFALDELGHPELQAGAPPDNMSVEGQVWGNPCYLWDVHAATGYDWWMRRLDRAFDLYDVVRLDHFLGFSSYYGIPQGKNALGGAWRFGPGMDFFRAAHERLGQLPLIAEDLGLVTPAVRALIAETGAPGMSVAQFMDEDVRESFTPPANTVAYASTHDTATLLGWVMRSFGVEGDAAKYLFEQLMDRVAGSSADVAIFQLQDIFALGDEARMNVPGVASGNWSWRADARDLPQGLERLKRLVAIKG